MYTNINFQSKKALKPAKKPIRNKQGLKTINGVTVLDNESGNRFYHKHMSKKAQAAKRAKRKAARKSRKGK